MTKHVDTGLHSYVCHSVLVVCHARQRRVIGPPREQTTIALIIFVGRPCDDFGALIAAILYVLYVLVDSDMDKGPVSGTVRNPAHSIANKTQPIQSNFVLAFIS